MVPPTLTASQPILVVDDNEDDFYATRRALDKANLRNTVIRAASGDEALALLRSTTGARPGMVLLDLNMPGLDGRKTLEAIKHDPVLKSIPVIILTTSTDERDIGKCYELGANTYIHKPVDIDGLIAAMQRLKNYWFEIALLPRDDKPSPSAPKS